MTLENQNLIDALCQCAGCRAKRGEIDWWRDLIPPDMLRETLSPLALEKFNKPVLDATLAERQKNYGTFAENAFIAQQLKDVMHGTDKWARGELNDDVAEALDLIVSKIARLLSGNAEHADGWHDIQGYAKLIEDRINKEKK